jgi:hypothetical protein
VTAFLIHQPRCVFIHIPKTAGRSMRDVLFAGGHDGPVDGPLPEAWRGHFAFAIVRNPFDRLVSAWKMFSEGTDGVDWPYPRDGQRGIGLRGFLDILTDDSITYDPPRRTFEQRIRGHALPQTHPFYCLDRADFVGRFEDLHDDWSRLADQLGLACRELPRVNTTSRGPYQLYFDDDTRTVAERFYADDLDRLGYRFESNGA